MLPPLLARDTITILRPVTVKDHGSDVADWTQPPEVVTVTGCSVQPTGGSEDRLRRDQLGAVISVWCPAGTTVEAIDRVMVDSYPGPLRLLGDPSVWDTNGRALDHVVLNLGAWEG